MGAVSNIPVRDASGRVTYQDSLALGVSVGDALKNRDFSAHMSQLHIRIKEDNLPKAVQWKSTGSDFQLEACKIPEQDGDYSLSSFVQLVAGWLKDQVRSA